MLSSEARQRKRTVLQYIVCCCMHIYNDHGDDARYIKVLLHFSLLLP
jgi:hypothetical protein